MAAAAEDKEQLVAAGGPVVVYRYKGTGVHIVDIIVVLTTTKLIICN